MDERFYLMAQSGQLNPIAREYDIRKLNQDDVWVPYAEYAKLRHLTLKLMAVADGSVDAWDYHTYVLPVRREIESYLAGAPDSAGEQR